MLYIILIAFGALGATLLGGLFALKFRDKLHLVLGFSAGAVIAVAFFDLLPEALELGAPAFEPSEILLFTAVGFVAYLVLDRFIHLHSHNEHEHASCGNGHHHKAMLGAGSLSIHSFLDGLAIGLAFQVSPALGAVVSVAVLVHDFSDGINTVSVILKNGGDKKTAFRWLITDACAPVFGILVGSVFMIRPENFAPLLAVFAGFFLYLGASDLLPESHHSHPTAWTTIATILGMAVLYGAIHIASF